jgi:hypothetical protein
MIFWTLTATLLLANNALAYIGPGSGMEFIGYAMSLLAMVGIAFFSILMWPFYTLLRWVKGSKSTPAAESAPANVENAAPPATLSTPLEPAASPLTPPASAP